jgi:hypothetical protein
MSSQSQQIIDLTEILAPYTNKWVALSEDQTRVMGSGATLKEALAEARRKGEADPVALFVPAISGPHVLGL